MRSEAASYFAVKTCFSFSNFLYFEYCLLEHATSQLHLIQKAAQHGFYDLHKNTQLEFVDRKDSQAIPPVEHK